MPLPRFNDSASPTDPSGGTPVSATALNAMLDAIEAAKTVDALTDASTVGKALVKASDAAAGRTILGITGTGGGFTARGQWTASTAYAVNDIITNNGNTWRVKTAHTSGLNPPSDPVYPLDPAQWSFLELWAGRGTGTSGGGGVVVPGGVGVIVIDVDVDPVTGFWPGATTTGQFTRPVADKSVKYNFCGNSTTVYPATVTSGTGGMLAGWDKIEKAVS